MKSFTRQKTGSLIQIFIFIAAFLIFPISGQENQSQSPEFVPFSQSDSLFQWGLISSFHGLPSERVNAIEQTPDGVLWFGTEKGLAKFDGRRVQTIPAENLSVLRILALKVDRTGRLWIGTSDGAFMRNNSLFNRIEGTKGHAVNSFLFGKNDLQILLSDEKGSIFQILPDGESNLAASLIADLETETKSLVELEEEVLIATHKRGVLSFADRSAKAVTNNTRQQFINTFAKNTSGELWIGTQTFTESSGLYRAKSIADWEKIDAAVGTVTTLSFDSAQNLWVGTKDRGAFKFFEGKQIERFTFENTAGGLRSNEILTTFVDREDVVWFGTTKGVCRFDGSSPKIEKLGTENESSFVRALFESSDGGVIAGTNNGLYVADGGNNWRPVAGFENRSVYSISEDSAGKLLIGTSTGFFDDVDAVEVTKTNYSSGDSTERESSDSVRSIETFQQKTYLGYYGRGLAVIKDSGIEFLDSGEIGIETLSLFSEEDKTLWIGTAKNGVFKFDGKNVVEAPQLAELKGIAVWSIDGNEDNGMWFGTEQGLYVLKDGALRKIMSESAVRNIKVFGDRSHNSTKIWCATMSGLIQVIPNDQFGWIISRTNVEQGLPVHSAFSILKVKQKDDSETLYFGTNRGIIRYTVKYTPPLLITTRILSKRLHSAEELAAGIDLEYPQNSLAVDIAGLSSRTFPEQFQYAFVLKNAKGEIVSKKLSSDSQFLMENLDAGSYTVEIGAFDKYLSQSAPLVFTFSIATAPFPWTTLALTVLLSFAIVALIWAIFSQRRISRTSAALGIANQELSSARLDLANEAERERRRISRDLHDQTLADLRHLLLLTDKLPNDADTVEKAGLLRTEIENVSSEIRNICEDLSPSVLENVGFRAALEWALSNAIQDSNRIINSEFYCDEKEDDQFTLPLNVQIQIYRIVQEVLSNIVQHSDASNIKLSLERSAGNLFQLVIEDNGQPFDPDQVRSKKGRGLNNIRARANLIHSEVSWAALMKGVNSFVLRKS